MSPKMFGIFFEDENAHELIVKAINATPTARTAEIHVNGGNPSGVAKVITLASADLKVENSFEHPANVAPQESTVEMKSATIAVTLQPYSLTVYRIPVQ